MVWEEDDIIKPADSAVGWFERSEERFVGKGMKLDAAALEVAANSHGHSRNCRGCTGTVGG